MNTSKEEIDILLRMEHINKAFSGVCVLNDVHFDLKSGEVHILAGENGAGKTTLIKISERTACQV
jgi:ribose transport system ATP-binding protein